MDYIKFKEDNLSEEFKIERRAFIRLITFEISKAVLGKGEDYTADWIEDFQRYKDFDPLYDNFQNVIDALDGAMGKDRINIAYKHLYKRFVMVDYKN